MFAFGCAIRDNWWSISSKLLRSVKENTKMAPTEPSFTTWKWTICKKSIWRSTSICIYRKTTIKLEHISIFFYLLVKCDCTFYLLFHLNPTSLTETLPIGIGTSGTPIALHHRIQITNMVQTEHLMFPLLLPRIQIVWILGKVKLMYIRIQLPISHLLQGVLVSNPILLISRWSMHLE